MHLYGQALMSDDIRVLVLSKTWSRMLNELIKDREYKGTTYQYVASKDRRKIDLLT